MSVAEQNDIAAIMDELGAAAKQAAKVLTRTPSAQKNNALQEAAKSLRSHISDILEANAKDMASGRNMGLSSAMLDRLMLDEARVEGIASALEDIAKLDDPIGGVMAEWTRPNGLAISRVRVPLGVIGIIYESRPNVTADAGALCMKAGNAAILRGGSESFHSSRAIVQCLHEGLKEAGLPESCIQLVPTTDRAAVGHMLGNMVGVVDVVVPRGGRTLVERVQQEARVPVLGHLEGLCHIYIDKSADPDMARDITVNAKLRRTGICGSAETLLLDESLDKSVARDIVVSLLDQGCEVRGDAGIQALDARVETVAEEDWTTEYLDAIISARMVKDVNEAIEHIDTYGSQHTEAVIAEDMTVVDTFLNNVDSANLFHNASTQFADGGEFGMGAEIGIATGKLHARGPVGLEQLTSYKYVVRGTGQTRP